jgi:glutamyl-Q tRNA(Asp) synthetase
MLLHCPRPAVQPPAVRFAPSPNGRLHLGHALSALTTVSWAERLGGRFLLRIEDIDTQRARPDFIDAIFADLAWLGLQWESPVLRQSEHFSAYAASAAHLTALGLLYPCFATRSEIAAAAKPGAYDPDGAPLYPALHRHLSPASIAARSARGEPQCLRLDMGRALAFAHAKLGGAELAFTELSTDGTARRVSADPTRWGDAVIIRKDTPASYHLAVVVDDARQGISHVTRGQDLFAATGLHRLLQVLLGLPEPLYAHHPLLLTDGGRKLAKSRGDTSLAMLRAQGWTAADVRQHIAHGLSGT